MRLIVKGTRDEAVKAAAARGIPLGAVVESANGHTVAMADDAHVTRAFLWFCEPANVERGHGYPAGTLLHYTHGA